jgi:sulfoxide reductase heme-binding subunit YedZ
MRYLKTGLFLLSLGPLARLIWLGVDDGLGANPVEFITRSTGTWALVFLCITLAMTPLRLLTKWSTWIKLRGMFGLFTFFYAVLHFSIWLWLDQNFDLEAMLKDVLKRPFITMGFAALVLMTPLAMTSSHWAQRALGRKWSALHKTIYAIAVLAILHYWWHKAGKNDIDTVAIYAAVIIFLLCFRIPFFRKRL